MVPDRQTDGQEWMNDAKTIPLRLGRGIKNSGRIRVSINKLNSLKQILKNQQKCLSTNF